MEQEGIRRAWQEIDSADLILYLVDTRDIDHLSIQKAWLELQSKLGERELVGKILLIENKIDTNNKEPGADNLEVGRYSYQRILLSVKENLGIESLKEAIKYRSGLNANQESKYAARRRHIEAIDQSLSYIHKSLEQLENRAPELVAEDLRLAHKELGEITGEYSSDDLLGEIFSGFCIGK